MIDKKKFIIPDATLVDFAKQDIITASAPNLWGDGGTDNGEGWGDVIDDGNGDM